MANIKSAKKRAKTAQVRRMKNTRIMSSVKTAIKKFDLAVQAEDHDKAKENMAVAIKKIDQAGSKGLLHKNNVANKKSRITRTYNQLAQG